MQKMRIGDDSIFVCMCPESRNQETCFHIEFMKDYGHQKFPLDQDTDSRLFYEQYA